MSEKILSLYRERLARERGAVRKDWGGRIAIGLAYPNQYRTGMSNLGFQILYKLLNERRDIVAERFFLPDAREMSLHLNGRKGLISLESQTPFNKFHIIAFSISFENDYPNLLRMLELGNVPILTEERDPPNPIVMAGGITTFLNPEPLSAFIDFFVLGEAEPVIYDVITLFSELYERGRNKEVILRSLAKSIPSVYVPSLYHVKYKRDGTIEALETIEKDIPVKRKVSLASLSEVPVPTSAILTPDTTFAGKTLVEIGRGCGRSCRFCAAGYLYRPPRHYSEETLISSIDKIVETQKSLGLVSTSIADTPGIETVMEHILRKGGKFSVSSLRTDSLTRGMIEKLKSAGQKTLTIAPEAGSERLRKVINKHLTEDEIVSAASLIGEAGGLNLRLYFLIGLPTEAQEDVEAIVDLVKVIKHHMIKKSKTRGKAPEIRLSINCFIPKPSTPFQWFPMEEVSRLKEKQKWLGNALRRVGGVRTTFDVPKWAYVQSLLSLGDRRVGHILLRARELNGDWKRAFSHSDINPDFFVYRPKGLDEILPWDFVDKGIDKEYLIKEYRLALEGKESDTCHVGTCKRCGAC
ncbi:MAG: radical SAM protein [Deltaproteobacteria bacterium]|nr:radical SAM protein [Deltaproteobacteria bacterium]